MTRSHKPCAACQHRVYGLTCDEYDALYDRASGACEICRRPWQPKAVRQCIDHDHEADGFTVRGLICHSCNSALEAVDAGARDASAAERNYLDRAWYRNEGSEHAARVLAEMQSVDFWIRLVRKRRAGKRGAYTRMGLHGTTISVQPNGPQLHQEFLRRQQQRAAVIRD